VCQNDRDAFLIANILHFVHRYGFHTHHRSFFVGEPVCDIEEGTTADALVADPIKESIGSSAFASRLIKDICESSQMDPENVHRW